MTSAIFHTPPPSIPQERPFSDMLQSLNFPEGTVPHIWFSKILGVPDIDTIVFCPKVGLFVIELKSWPLTCILGIAYFGLEIDPSCKSSKIQPWQQAKFACDTLKEQMKRSSHWSNLNNPWLSSGTSLFRISRTGFMNHFPKVDNIAREQINYLCDRIIFADDLEDGDRFIERLKFMKYNPITGRGISFDDSYKYTEKMAEELDRYFNWKGSSSESPSAYDYKRLEIIEGKEEKRLDRVDLDYPVMCTGYAGTGKTVLGLQATLRKNVPSLFLCFNKVLAGDIRRITSLSPRFQQFRFNSHDIHELISICEDWLDITKPQKEDDQTFDDWTEKRVQAIITKDNGLGKILGKSWEFIVVDEAQDLFDAAWSLINQLVGPTTSLFVVDGKHQLLYRESSGDYLYKTLRESMPDDNFIQKRRVFRTTDSTFLLSQLFMLSYPSREEAQSIWGKKLGPQYRKALTKGSLDQESDDDFELPRKGGAPPKIINLWEKNKLNAPNLDVGIRIVGELIENAYKKIINYDGKAGDILILVPFTYKNERTSSSINWLDVAKKACEKVGLPYIDYTDKQQKREVYTPNEVRIATFQSCRGIEGLHSIVLGFEGLAASAQRNSQRIRNLGYIVLSRSVFDTDILYFEPDTSVFRNTEVEFLKSILDVSGL